MLRLPGYRGAICSSSVQTAVVRQARQHPQKHPWIMRLLAKKLAKLVAVAVANKMARIAWAITAKGGYYRAPELAAAA
jgi:transposase